MPSSDRAPGMRFLATFLAAAALFGLAAVAITALVDPFGVLRPGGGPGLCGPGVKVLDRRHLALILPRAYRPAEVITGSSRVAWGFRESDFAPRAEGRTANLGVLAASFEDVDYTVRQALEHAPVRRVWIGLDYAAFAGRPGHTEDRFKPAPVLPGEAIAAVQLGLLNPQAVTGAMNALADPDLCADPPYTALGFSRAQGLPGNAAPSAVATLPAMENEAASVMRWRLPDAQRDVQYLARMKGLADLLADLERREIEAVLFLSPSHPMYDQAIVLAGLATHRRLWRDDVRRMAERRRAVLVESDTPAFLNSIATPECPPDHKKADCQFFDPVHFRPMVGSAIAQEARRLLREPHTGSP